MGKEVAYIKCNDAEWHARVDLAAAYRACDNWGLNEGICNHLTLAVPGEPDKFLVIPYGLLWSEVTASNLLTVRMGTGGKWEVLQGKGQPETTAMAIHGAIHRARPTDAAAVVHTHQPWTTALCCLKDPTLRMVHQNCLRFHNDIAYDTTFNGLVTDANEGDRISQKLGSKKVLMHSNHGVILVGRTIAEAIDDLYYLERAAEVVVKALSTGQELQMVSDKAAQSLKADFDRTNPAAAASHLDALKRVMKKSQKDADFDDDSGHVQVLHSLAGGNSGSGPAFVV
ncbi:hypothetical protein WJX72_009270 [[Myrmecia] bisecta]|uniref:Class II aldolase/adducin N-terminal domain-containing protein n=1 Tax=[Myrmecia] bisecta TaxID=41462 RepID=A0AAW1P3D8_9CHLO